MTKLPSRIRAAFARWAVLRADYALRQLVDMPVYYLVIMAGLSGAVVALLSPRASKATEVYEQLLSIAPWYVSTTIGLWLFSAWVLVGLCALTAAAHGRALGERLFNPPRPPSKR